MSAGWRWRVSWLLGGSPFENDYSCIVITHAELLAELGDELGVVRVVFDFEQLLPRFGAGFVPLEEPFGDGVRGENENIVFLIVTL